MDLAGPVPEAVAVPCAAAVEMLQVMGSPSASVACKVRLKGVGALFSDIVTLTEAPSVITGIELTVSVAEVVGVIPAVLVKTARYRLPLSVRAAAKVSGMEVAPVMSFQVAPLSVLTCH